MSTKAPLSPEDLFAYAGLTGNGPILWKKEAVEEAIKNKFSGIYIITANLTGNESEVVYIGRAKQLRRRLQQFLRHKYGKRGPHKGGQEILRLPETSRTLQIYYAFCDDYIEQEHRLLEKFEHFYGILPHDNKKRGDVLSPQQEL